MAESRRRQIANFIVDELKKINGSTSTFNASYTYNTDVSNNVFRRLKFIDEVNDFPSIYVNAGRDIRDYSSVGLTSSDLAIILRCYTKDEDPVDISESLLEDVEHILYNVETGTDKGIQQIEISSISTDQGLTAPFGIGEVSLLVRYDLEN